MKENIKTKDVQKTEYLDKNGLDMLWTKVKENTHNQVEVEYNRAKAKEDSLSQEIASVKPAEGKVFLQVEDENPTKVLKDDTLRFGDSSTQIFSLASGDGFFIYNASDGSGAKTVNISSTGIESDDERKSDTKVWNTNGGITDLTSYALNSDVTEKIATKADTTALTALEEKVTANTTSISALRSDLPTAATKEKLGVVKVGDGLNVTDGVISVAPDYIIDMLSYGVEWDTTVADPTCTRIGNPLFHKQLPIQSQYKGCVVKEGAINYYLDPNDWSKKADGTPSVLDGTDGDVMVHTPTFYGKSGSNGNKRWVRISTTKIDSTWTYIPPLFISAYKITINEGSAAPKVASVVNTSSSYRGGENAEGYDQYLSTDKFKTNLGKPRTDIPRATMRTYANNCGQELLRYEFYKWVFYWAYVIEYANFNSQEEFNSELTSDGYHQGGLGPGVTQLQSSQWRLYNGSNPLTPCGYTNEFGNFSGVKQMVIPAVETPDGITVGDDTTLYANRWRGFENPFGDIYTNLDGIIIKKNSDNKKSGIYAASAYSDATDDISHLFLSGTIVVDPGFIKEFDLGETGEIIPQSVGGSESTYKCDNCRGGGATADSRTLIVGGSASENGWCGLSYFNSSQLIGNHNANIGFRSVLRTAI